MRDFVQAFLADIRKLTADQGLEIKPLGINWPAPSASLDSDLYRAIATVAGRQEPGVPVVPFTLFVNKELPPAYVRYLERAIRDAFEFGATPIKLRMRRRAE